MSNTFNLLKETSSMRLFSILAAMLALAAVGCTSADNYRGEVSGDGSARAQAFHVVDGKAQPITKEYTVNGKFSGIVQTVPPYMTLDGDWTPNVAGGATAVERPGDVLIRPSPRAAAAPMPGAGSCSSTPAAPPPAPAASDCGCPEPVAAAAPADDCRRAYAPVCESADYPTVSAFNFPGVRKPAPAWPCAGAQAPVPGAVGDVVLAPVGFLAHFGSCLMGFLRCVVNPSP